MKNATLITSLSLAIAVGAGSQAWSASDGHPKKHHMHSMSFEELDTNGDGQITREEMEARHAARFATADSDGNGTVSSDELIAFLTERGAERAKKYAGHMIEKHDADGDGELSIEEMQSRHKGGMFRHGDSNGDGMISAEEFAEMREKHGGHHGKGHEHKHEGHSADE